MFKKRISILTFLSIFTILHLFLALILVSVIYLNNNVIDYSIIMDQISLASGVSSILLAIIAILYAFFQSYESAKQKDSLEKLLSEISNKANEIGTVKQEVINSKKEITSAVLQIASSYSSSFDQLDTDIKKADSVNSKNISEMYKSLFNNLIESTLKEVDEHKFQGKTSNMKKSQEFYVTVTTKDFKPNQALIDGIDLSIPFIKHFRTHVKTDMTLPAISSNYTVFSDYLGYSFNLSFIDENKQWSVQEVKHILSTLEIEGFNVFSVAELFYANE
jgi:hypothetical protein